MLSDQSFYPILQYKILAAVTQPPMLRPVRSLFHPRWLQHLHARKASEKKAEHFRPLLKKKRFRVTIAPTFNSKENCQSTAVEGYHGGQPPHVVARVLQRAEITNR